MNDNQLMHAMSLDDTYRVEQVLARGEGGITELVTIDGAGPFVRKKSRRSLPAAMYGRHSRNVGRPVSPASKRPTNYPSTLLSYTTLCRVGRFPRSSKPMGR